MLFFWLLLGIIFLIAELATLALVSIWFLIGTIVALVFYFAGYSFLVQLSSMVLVSLVFIVLFIVFRNRLGFTESTMIPSNYDRFIGKVAIVVADIDNIRAQGQIQIQGQVWSARALNDDQCFFIGDKVRIHAIQGVKMIVSSE